jgi:hypothetical protein
LLLVRISLGVGWKILSIHETTPLKDASRASCLFFNFSDFDKGFLDSAFLNDLSLITDCFLIF